jgi:hypothetical protein
MKHSVWLLLCLAWPLLAQSTTNHYETLQQSRWFAVSGGFANATTPEAFALAAICNETNAAATLRRLIAEPGSVQQLYGLLGLRILNAADFNTTLPQFMQSKTKAGVLVGCIAGDRETADVARRIRDNRWSIQTRPVPGGKYAPAVVEREQHH